MPVTSINLTRISCERNTTSGGPKNLQVHTSATIRRISETNHPVAGKSYVIDFVFQSEYIQLGIIKLEGEAVVKGQDVNEENKGEFLNKIAQHCVVLASFLARDMNMPPPIPLPKFEVNQKQKKEDEGGYIR